jgi:hypothetical protein
MAKGRPPTHDWAALIQEYQERTAGLEGKELTVAKKAIKTDFSSRKPKISWGTFDNQLREWKKAHQSTLQGDTMSEAVEVLPGQMSIEEADTGKKVRKEKGFSIMEIRLQDIIVDSEVIQQRVEMNKTLVKEYIELMTESETLPALVVFGPTEDGKYYLSEGFHRYAAATDKELGFLTMKAEIRPGGRDEAIDYACEANIKHGLRPSEKDRIKAVNTQLTKWPERGDREIARKCGVSPSIVGKYRGEYVHKQLFEHPERSDEEIAKQWRVSPKTVGEYRVERVKQVLHTYPTHSNEDLAQLCGMIPETVATMRAELYPPKAEEPPADSWKPVQVDTSHESQGQDTWISSDHETTVQMDTHHELTPESKDPSDPVSEPEPLDRRPPLKTLEQRVLELYTILDQESYSIQTILNAVQEAGGYEVFVNALDSSQRAALLAKMTVALRELAVFHQSFEMLVNGPMTTTTISETPPDEVQGTDELETCFECGRALTVEGATICEHCGEMFHGSCLQSHMEQVNDEPDDKNE